MVSTRVLAQVCAVLSQLSDIMNRLEFTHALTKEKHLLKTATRRSSKRQVREEPKIGYIHR